MARVTVEDCLKYVDNHFQLVHIASERARQLDEGYLAKIENTGDKNTVLALREIAEGKIDKESLLQRQSRLFNETEEGARGMEEDLRNLARKELTARQGAEQGYKDMKPITAETVKEKKEEVVEDKQAVSAGTPPVVKTEEAGEYKVEKKTSVARQTTTARQEMILKKAPVTKKAAVAKKPVVEKRAMAIRKAPPADKPTEEQETADKKAPAADKATEKQETTTQQTPMVDRAIAAKEASTADKPTEEQETADKKVPAADKATEKQETTTQQTPTVDRAIAAKEASTADKRVEGETASIRKVSAPSKSIAKKTTTEKVTAAESVIAGGVKKTTTR